MQEFGEGTMDLFSFKGQISLCHVREPSFEKGKAIYNKKIKQNQNKVIPSLSQ